MRYSLSMSLAGAFFLVVFFVVGLSASAFFLALVFLVGAFFAGLVSTPSSAFLGAFFLAAVLVPLALTSRTFSFVCS